VKERQRNRINIDILGNLDQLPAMLKAERARQGLTQRAAAEAMGIHFSTICRVEKGGWPDAPGLLAIAAWLDVTLGWFTAESEQRDAYQRGWDDCAVSVRAALDATPRPEES